MSSQQRAGLVAGQSPWATILTCADSRVAPELIFGGMDLGELFVARNAGNTANTATLGTIEYGAEHLGVPLIVVLGHERCGAVSAACEVVEKHAKLPGFIAPMNSDVQIVINRVFGMSDECDSNWENWLSQAHAEFILAFMEKEQAREEAVITQFLESRQAV